MSRRKARDPRTRDAEIRARFDARRAVALAPSWALSLRLPSGDKHVVTVPLVPVGDSGERRPARYDDVVKLRDEYLSTGRYESCWMFMTTA